MNEFIRSAENTKIKIKEKKVTPVNVCRVIQDSKYYKGWGIETLHSYVGGDNLLSGSICYDLGEHYVGKLSFDISHFGEICDSPIKLKITFAEVPFEFSYTPDNQPGWLSYSWIQEEIIHIDVSPSHVELPRRYACRYVKIDIIAKNKNMSVVFDNVKFTAQSSAGFDYIPETSNPTYEKMMQVSYRTLRDCMQTVYEDGPKRDRRLWLGDIRLQALVNYATVGDTELVKRCLYLFAGLSDERGVVPSCLYTVPKALSGEIFLCDYSLLFMACLWDYYSFTGDKDLCAKLFNVAYKQFENFYKIVNPDGTIQNQPGWWCFIDWDGDVIPRPSAMAAIAAYCLGFARDMAAALGYDEKVQEAEKYRKLICEAGNKFYFNAEKGVYEENGVVSWHLNCYMILAGAVSKEEGIKIMNSLKACDDAILPVTPYVYHYIMEAYAQLGMVNEMEHMLDDYWGEMVDLGADTFWEAFKKGDPFFSPYDDSILNSYCHAWSCTPAYFIKKYL